MKNHFLAYRPLLSKLSLAMIGLLALSQAQAGNYYHYKVEKQPNNQGLYLAATPQGQGLLDSQGREVTTFGYEQLAYSNHIAVAKDNQARFGILDEKGGIIAPFQYQFIGSFAEGRARASRMIEGKKKNGYLDSKGKEIIPFIYDDVNDFYQGYAYVIRDNHYFVIDKMGKEKAIDPNYHEVTQDSKDFYKFTVPDKNDKDNSYEGLLNYKGDIIIPPVYQDITVSKDYIRAKKTDELVDYFNYQGKPITLPTDKTSKDQTPTPSDKVDDGIDGAYIFSVKKDNDKKTYGVKDKQGKILIEPIYEKIRFEEENYYAENRDPTSQTRMVYEGGYYASPMYSYDSKLPHSVLFDKHGKIVYQQNNIKFTPLTNRLIIVEKTVAEDKPTKKGLIDSTGKLLIPILYDRLSELKTQKDTQKNPLIVAELDGKEALLDSHHQVFVPFGKYSHITCDRDCKDAYGSYIDVQNEFIDDEHRVNYNHGLINTTGYEILPPIYKKIFIDFPYLIVTQKINQEESKGVFSLDGKTAILPTNYENIISSTSGNVINFIVKDKQHKFGIANPQGKFIAEPVYDDITDFKIGKTQMGYVLIKDRQWGIIDEFGKPIMPINNSLKPMDMSKLIQ